MWPKNGLKSIKWLNYGLLIINITALATLLFFRNAPVLPNESPDIRSVRFLKDRLELSDQQYREVLQMSDKTFRKYNYVLDMLCEANVDMLEEMASASPDGEKLDRITRRIGRMHAVLKNLTIDYFDSVRSICNPEQSQKLTHLFKEIMQLDLQCDQCNRTSCPRKERLSQLGLESNE